jgi:hypothetical protein
MWKCQHTLEIWRIGVAWCGQAEGVWQGAMGVEMLRWNLDSRAKQAFQWGLSCSIQWRYCLVTAPAIPGEGKLTPGASLRGRASLPCSVR